VIVLWSRGRHLGFGLHALPLLAPALCRGPLQNHTTSSLECPRGSTFSVKDIVKQGRTWAAFKSQPRALARERIDAADMTTAGRI